MVHQQNLSENIVKIVSGHPYEYAAVNILILLLSLIFSVPALINVDTSSVDSEESSILSNSIQLFSHSGTPSHEVSSLKSYSIPHGAHSLEDGVYEFTPKNKAVNSVKGNSKDNNNNNNNNNNNKGHGGVSQGQKHSFIRGVPAEGEEGETEQEQTSELKARIFIHYTGNRHSNGSNNREDGDERTSSRCYSYSANRARWRVVPHFNIIGDGLSSAAYNKLEQAASFARNRWNTARGSTILGGATRSDRTLDEVDLEDTDGFNDVLFASISDNSILAVTITYGYFDGPESERRIIETDVILNSRVPWTSAADLNTNAYVAENIVTHEHGHVLGMGDLTKSKCRGSTMYYSANKGETSKQSIDNDSKLGMNNLYNGD